MVVPKIATIRVSESPVSSSCGTSAPTRHRAPVDLHREDHADIGEQREGQPLQHADIAVVGHEHDRRAASTIAKPTSVKVRAPAAEHQPRRRPHGREVGADD